MVTVDFATAVLPASSTESMFAVLGPMEVRGGGGRLVSPGPAKQRLVLALLLCEAGTEVPAEQLLRALWPKDPPRNARKSLQVYVSNLRAVLEHRDRRRIVYGTSGYRIEVEPRELDASRFEQLARTGIEAVRESRPQAAVPVLRQALDLWRGPALKEFEHVDAIRHRIRRLAERRLTVVEHWARAELALGDEQAVLDGVEQLAVEHPTSERLRALQIIALHRRGRSTEALSVYDEVRQLLAREYGMTPGPVLRAAHSELVSEGARPLRVNHRGAPAGPVILPGDPPDLVGRADEVAAAMRALTGDGGPRRVVLSGQVGVGKTALALRIAHSVRGGFPDGVVTVRLRDAQGGPRTTASLLAELWRILHVSPDPPADIDAGLGLWQAFLATRRVLLLFDDARDEAVPRGLAPHQGASAALITARSRLGALESAVRIGVDVPSADEAAELLARIVPDGRVDRDDPAVRDIAAAVGRLPLGLRAAGEKLAMLRHLPVAAFAARLADDSQCLQRIAVGDSPVQSRLDAALRDLPASVLGPLRELSAVPLAPFTPGTAARAVGCPAETMNDLLEALIEYGVIPAPQAGSPYFALPRLMHLRLRLTQ